MVPFIFNKNKKIYRVDNGNIREIYNQISTQYMHLGINDVAIRFDGQIFMVCLHEILKFDPATDNTQSIYSDPSGYLKRITIRQIASRDVLYFSSGADETTVYSLEGYNHPEFYFKYKRLDLMVPSNCPPHDETGSMLNAHIFAFDQNENLFVSNGNNVPCGYYRYSSAGENTVTGSVERIHVSERSCWDLACGDSNTLYSLTGLDTDSPFVEIVRVDLLPFPPHEEVVFSQSTNPFFDKQVRGFALIPPDSNSPPMSSGEFRWLQRALNVVLDLDLLVDGKFGPATRTALKYFQQQNGLVADGIYGMVTKAKIIEVLQSNV